MHCLRSRQKTGYVLRKRLARFYTATACPRKKGSRAYYAGLLERQGFVSVAQQVGPANKQSRNSVEILHAAAAPQI